MAIGALVQAIPGLANSIFGGPETPSTAISGGGTYAPGGISIGSRVVGSGSASTSVPSPAVPSVAVNSSVPAQVGSSWINAPWIPWAAGAALVVLLVFSLLPRRRDRSA